MELYSMLYAGLDRRGVWGRKDMCICMARSLQCAPETASTMWIGSPPIQNKKFKVCGGKAWRKHLYIHVTNHRTCPKLDTQYRSNEWMGSDFLTSKPSRMIPWPMCLGSLEWDASQRLPSSLVQPQGTPLPLLCLLFPRCSSDVMSHEEIAKRSKFPLGSPSFWFHHHRWRTTKCQKLPRSEKS